MRGVCKNRECEKRDEEVFVHRGTWIVAVPKCRSCKESLHRTPEANKQVRSRMQSMLPGHPSNEG